MPLTSGASRLEIPLEDAEHLDSRKNVQVDARMATNVDKVFGCGDAANDTPPGTARRCGGNPLETSQQSGRDCRAETPSCGPASVLGSAALALENVGNRTDPQASKADSD